MDDFQMWINIKSVTFHKKSMKWIILLLFALLQGSLSAQDEPTDGDQKAPRFEFDKDTIGLDFKYYHINDVFKTQVVSDTFYATSFLEKVGVHRNGEYVNTGNYGSSEYSLWYQNEVNPGFYTGYNQYRPFQIRKENFRFYEQNRPVSELFFSQMGGQDNIVVGANFSRNFADGLTLSMNYNRISHRGFYRNQETKTTAFGIGMRYQSPKNRYNALMLLTQNANTENHNGGITIEDVSDEQFLRNVPVVLDGAATRQQERSFSFVQYLKLNSAKNKLWNIFVQNDLTYEPTYFKFSDKNISDLESQAFYDFILDQPAGLRRYVKINKLSDGFFIHGEKTQGLNGKIGIVYDHYQIDDAPTRFNRSDLTAVAEGKVPFLGFLQLDVASQLGLLKNIGNFNLSGDLELKVKKIGFLRGGIKIFNYEPAYKDIYLNLNNEAIRNADLSHVFGTEIHAHLTIPSVKLTATVRQSLINDPIFYDNGFNPTQYNGLFTISQIQVSHRLKLKSIHLDNDVYFQLQSSDIYPVPRFFSMHQLYYSGSWFKKALNINIGLYGRMIPDYNGPGFQPLTGSFYATDTNLSFYPESNIFLSAQVSEFRAFFVMENFSDYFIKETRFDVAHYPQFNPSLRIGLQWLLKD